LLEPAGAIAPTYPSNLVNAPDLRVVHYRDGSLGAVCDAGVSPRVDLSADEAMLHRVSWRDARLVIAHALGICTSTTPVASVPGVLRIGTWEPQRSTAFPVVLAAHSKVTELASLIRGAVLESDRPALVLTPTADGWTDELRGWVESRKGTLVPLHDVLEADDDGMIVASELWPQFLGSFAKRAGVSFPSATQNKRPRRRRGERLSKIAAIRRELVLEAESRVNIVKFAYECGDTPQLPPITRIEIALRAGCRDYDLSRAFKDDAGADLKPIFDLLCDPDGLLRWWENHRRLTPSCS